jgi:hypothetical protein
MQFSALVALGTLVFTFVNFLKYLRAGNASAVLTQLIAWLAGMAGIALVAHTQFATDITFGQHTLATLNGSSQLFLGLIATSILSTVNEFKKAIDNNDSAKTPSLLTGKV